MTDKEVRKGAVIRFWKEFEKLNFLTEFDDLLWVSLVDTLTVYSKKKFCSLSVTEAWWNCHLKHDNTSACKGHEIVNNAGRYHFYSLTFQSDRILFSESNETPILYNFLWSATKDR